MLDSVMLCIALIQANPVSMENAARTPSAQTTIDLREYHPTVDYIPHIVERRSRSSDASTPNVRAAKYELVAHASVSRSEMKIASTSMPLPKSTSRVTAPKLQASFEIPVPDDLTMIQPKSAVGVPAKEAVVGPMKTSIPRVERILGIDSAHLPVTTTSVDEQVEAPDSDEIPVPSLGS